MEPVIAERGQSIANPARVLDTTLPEMLPPYQREAAADDPWLSPTESDVYLECQIRIAAAAAHQRLAWAAARARHSPEKPSPEVVTEPPDLRELSEEVGLDPGEIDVVVLAGNAWNQRQIAEWLEISQATVCRRLHSGRRKLLGHLPRAVVHSLVSA